MSESMLWVKEAGVEGSAFTVYVSSSAVVDHLKDAIKKKMEYKFGAPLLNIKETDDGVVERVGKKVSEFSSGGSDSNPIYFSQPATAGKFSKTTLPLDILM